MNATPIKAVLFDLDGTLVDSAPDLTTALNRLLADLGRPPEPEARVRRWIGNGARRLVARALTGSDDRDPPAAEWERAMVGFFDHYGECMNDRTRLYAGTLDCLQALTAVGLPLGVVTNKDQRFTDRLLEALNLRRFFGITVSGDTLAVKKPDGEPLRHAARALGSPASGTLMVGDSMADVLAARDAGMRIACVPYGYRLGDDIFASQPDVVVERLDELTRFINDTGMTVHE